MADIATLGLAIDSRSAVQATKDLEKLAETSTSAEKATDSLGATSSRTSDRFEALLESLHQLNRTSSMMQTDLASLRSLNEDVARSTVSRTVAVEKLVETEEQAALRIQAMVKASMEEAKSFESVASSSDIAKSKLDTLTTSTEQLAKEAVTLNNALSKGNSAREIVARQNAQMSQSSKLAAESTKDLSYAKEAQRQLDIEAAAAADKFMFKLQQEAAQVGKTRAEILEMKAAMHGVSDGAQPMIDQIKKSEETMHKMNFATVGARRELLVLAHEASQGQWQRFGGSLMVLGERVDAMGVIFSSTGAMAAGAAVGVAALAVAAYEGHKETAEFNKQLQLTNGYAGITKNKFNDLANTLSKETLTGIGGVKDTLQQVISTGKFSSDTIGIVSKTIVDFSHVSGQSSEDIVKDFEKITDGVAKWAFEQNKHLHFLSTAEYEHIKSLEKHGQQSEAVQETMRSFGQRAQDEIQSLGYLESAWRTAGVEVGKFWDSLKGIGREKTIDEKIAEAEKLIKSGGRSRGMDDSGKHWESKQEMDANVSEAQKALDFLKKNKEFADRMAEIRAQRGKDAQLGNVASDGLEAIDLQTQKQSKLNEELAKTKRWESDLKRANPESELVSAEAIIKREAEIRKKYKDKSGSAENNAEIDGAISEVERNIKLVEDAYRNDQRVRSELHRASKMSDSEFYAQEKDARNQHLADLMNYYATEKKVIEQAMKSASDVKKVRLQTRLGALVDKVETATAANDTDNVISSIQSDVRANNKAQNIKNLTEMTNSYLESLREQVRLEQESNAIQVRSVGQGSMQTALEQRLNSLTKQYQRDDLKLQRDLNTATSESKKDGVDKDFFEMKISELKKQQEARKDVYEEMYRDTTEGEARLRAAQGDWTNGAKQSLANYADYAGNVASQTASMFQNGFRNMEDAVTNFAMTGKLNFHNFAEGVISDLIRIYIRQQMVGMFGSLKGFLGIGAGAGTGGASFDAGVPIPPTFAAKGATFSGGSITAFSKGGAFSNTIADTPTMAPMAVFGEAGPEAIMPLKRGPDGSLGIRATGTKQQSTSGDGIAIHTQINIASDGTAKAESSSSGRAAESGKQIADMVNGLISKAMADQMRQGGLLWKMKNGQN